MASDKKTRSALKAFISEVAEAIVPFLVESDVHALRIASRKVGLSAYPYMPAPGHVLSCVLNTFVMSC